LSFIKPVTKVFVTRLSSVLYENTILMKAL
jgi:hypothetical protein